MLGVKLAQLVVTDTSSHHGYVIHVSVDDHRFERVVSVARGEFKFDVIVPAL